MRPNRTELIILLAILFVFFLQALSDFIQSIYAFGLLVTAFTPQLAAALLLFSPVALLVVRGEPPRRWLVALGALAVLGRLVEPLLDPGGRLVACGIRVGAFMLLWPFMLAVRTRRLETSHSGTVLGWPAAWGLLLAVMLSIFFRAAGSSLDVSEVGFTQVIAWLLAAAAAWIVWRAERKAVESQPPREPEIASSGTIRPPRNDVARSHEERREASLRALSVTPNVTPDPSHLAPGSTQRELASSGLGTAEERRLLDRPRNDVGVGRVIGLCVGLASVIVLLYFGFTSPTVMARWTDASYLGILGVLVVTYSLFTGLRVTERLSPPVVIVWNLLFVAALVLTILPHQVAFPPVALEYPIVRGSASPLWQIALYLMLLLSPVIFVDFVRFVDAIAADEPSLRQLGGAFALAALFVLVMVFLHVFTTIYDYARPIGPVFRDRFWLVYLIAGLGLVLPLLLVPQASPRDRSSPQPRRFTLIAVATLAAVSLAALWLTNPKLPPTPSTGGSLRVMTYNIQQGFDKVGDAALPAQLDAIRRVQPDVLGLEESDTARVANGNVDAVRYFADHLGMYSYYGPPTTVGTFGIALLSKYPIQNPRTFYMYSTGEQTACIQAQIAANGTTYNVFVTHLGNDGPIVQLQNVLSRVGSLPNVILVGDFNFDPTTPQYALASESLFDAWRLRWPTGRQLTTGAEGRIDQVFVSPGMTVTDAEYVPNPSSDHPYLYAVVK